MIEITCLCGQLRVALSKRPDYIHQCNCTLCRKSGARWGYFHPSEASVTGASKGYSRSDKPEPAAEIRFCESCGATTHFTLTAEAAGKFGNTMMGANMLLADEAELTGVELRYPNGKAWSGEGEFAYVREARILG